MSSSHLTTTWVCVATEGETVDGRVIEPEWLKESAVNYDPSYYTALIWEDHKRSLANLGEVLAAKSETNNGLTKLYVKLRPTLKLIEYNKLGQKLFCSIEIEEDFQGKGIFYLSGIAVTDTPASVGTDRLRFSTNKYYFSKGRSKVMWSRPIQIKLDNSFGDHNTSWFSAISAG